ncbi:MAG: aminotransferase class I/II-fold pyridoxal phosphate-dependent enzyme [Deltaproteobacteria bacterium]|nr:aminotransferase class I/II-fold pyridoxal phosphate-dependent enzyme [Deltaproteobacteria bacterium]
MRHDFRSDTVTVPTSAMRAAIASAPVGDDVFGDDPSVNELQERGAALLGKEAALFVPSGTMANQVAIRTHTEPGDEIIAEATSHIFLYEGGGFAALSGVSLRQVAGAGGILDPVDVQAAVRPAGGLSHYPVSKLICVENTANRAGGTIYPPPTLHALRAVADAEGLRMHLDGARLMNAAVGLGVSVDALCAPFDSISLCLSKGLGAPVGSLLVGSRTFIDRAHRFRKMFGGGMRQAGVLAAAGVHALDHHVERLAEDHTRARRLAEEMAVLPGIRVNLETVQTNMAYVDFQGTGRAAAWWVGVLAEAGVFAAATDVTTVRFVTHLQVGDDAVDAAVKAVEAAL